MKIETLKQRLDKNRPMITVTLRIPEDVVEELKQLAPILGFAPQDLFWVAPECEVRKKLNFVFV